MDKKLSPHQLEVWQKKQFSQMTPVQAEVFDKLYHDENVIAIAPTGSGKTLAYVLPLLQKIEANQQLQCIVLTASQELAQQTAHVIREFSQNVKTQVITGGANMKRQLEKLKEKPEIIVATPGRLLELSNQSKKIKYHCVKTVVIDEADYLLSQEHIGSIRDIVKKAPSKIQLAMFSATDAPILHDVEKWFGKTNEHITVAGQSTIEHGYISVENRKRAETLKKLLQTTSGQVIAFVNNIANLATLYEKMLFENVSVVAIHSDMSHIERQQAMQQLKDKKVKLLLTTDLAARGLDIDAIEMIVQYDLPRETSIYTHRSGRTGRMGKSGYVISFVEKHNVSEYLKLTATPIVTEYQLSKGKLLKK